MPNFLTSLRKNNPNVYALTISIFLSLWYSGLTGLFNYYFPDRGPALSLIFLIIPLAVFMGDNGKLDELYKIGDANPDLTDANTAVINVAANNLPKRKEFMGRNKF